MEYFNSLLENRNSNIIKIINEIQKVKNNLLEQEKKVKELKER